MRKILTLLLALLLSLTAAASPALAAGPETESGSYIVQLCDSPGASLMSISSGAAAHGLVSVSKSELDRLVAEGLAEDWGPDLTVKLFNVSNDTYSGRQWNLSDIGVSAAWNAGLNGEGVSVAVIDSGIYSGHEDLKDANILPGKNLITNSQDVSDTLGHGTSVTGILAAVRNNSLGIAGITDKISIVPLKCFANEDEASLYDICDAIYTAVDDFDCSVICMSLGAEQDSRFMRDAVEYAFSKNVIIVASVGNSGGSAYYYPSAYEDVIGVGSYSSSGSLSYFSEVNDSVFVSAPGSDVLTTYIGAPDSYALVSGTSFSAPHVAAMAAMAKSLYPDISTDAFKDLLIASSTDAGAPGYDTAYGYGRINIPAFVTALQTMPLAGTAAFTDTDGHWAKGYIDHCVRLGLFTGVSDTSFAPEGPMTRAMLVTMLYRYDAGSTSAGEGSRSFTDLADASAWYYDAVRWADANGIVTGYDDGSFRPDDPITREQLCAVLYRYSGSPAAEDHDVLSIFTDSGDVSGYARSAVTWCYVSSLMGGVGSSRLDPQGGATRAQVAALISRFIDAG